jgi:hypothetical protein
MRFTVSRKDVYLRTLLYQSDRLRTPSFATVQKLVFCFLYRVIFSYLVFVRCCYGNNRFAPAVRPGMDEGSVTREKTGRRPVASAPNDQGASCGRPARSKRTVERILK